VNGYQKFFKDGFIKRHSLTKRETEILTLITQALSNKQIAEELYISDQTVSVHRKNIMRKLGVSNTAGLIKEAYENFLVKY
jgi:DNA-binding NarL/FixJ family response regulator